MRIKLIVVLSICFITTLKLSAQITAGIKLGVSIPDIHGNTEQSKGYTSRFGPYFGASVASKISSRFSLQTEVNYSPHGGKRDGLQPIDNSYLQNIPLPPGTILYANFKNETRLNYLEIPVMLKYRIGQQKSRIFYYANLGPYVAFKLNTETITSGNSVLYVDAAGTERLTLPNGVPVPAQSFDAKTDISKEIKTVNAGVIGGVGTGYKIGKQSILLEARFTRGLTGIQTDEQKNGRNQTGSLIFAAGYVYSF